MAPKKNKSKVEEETIANMSIGWRKRKMSESLVRELENMGLLQSQGVIQWRAGEGEDYPWKVPLRTLCSVILWNVVSLFPCQNFSIGFFTFGESNYIILLPNPSCIFLFLLISVKHSLGFFPISTFFNISSSLFLSQMLPILPLSRDVNWYFVLRPKASTWLMIQRVKEPNGRSSGSRLEILNPRFQKGLLAPPSPRKLVE